MPRSKPSPARTFPGVCGACGLSADQVESLAYAPLIAAIEALEDEAGFCRHPWLHELHEQAQRLAARLYAHMLGRGPCLADTPVSEHLARVGELQAEVERLRGELATDQ